MMSRRQFVTGTLGAASGLPGLSTSPAAAEPPPETTRLRLYRFPSICLAPQYLAEDLLRAEGFTDVQYLQFPEGGEGVYTRLGSGAIDITQWFVAPYILEVDRGTPIVFLAGVHTGCFDLFATDRVRAVRNLRGKTIAVPWRGSGPETLVATILAHVGIDPVREVTFVVHPPDESIRLLAAGAIDAYLGFPPIPQELRARKIGHVLLSSTVDRPWSQYFCCLAVANREFVRRHPVATKRAVRAILKANQICAVEPDRAARALVARGFAKSYEYSLQALRDIPYGQWREYDPEDTIRFFTLRLRDAGLVKSTPQKIIAEGTDWQFLNELRRELKS